MSRFQALIASYGRETSLVLPEDPEAVRAWFVGLAAHAYREACRAQGKVAVRRFDSLGRPL